MAGMSGCSLRIESAGRSDTGRVRRLNEDSFLAHPDIGVWAVADGMGGHDAGDFASQTLVAELGYMAGGTVAELLAELEGRVRAANDRMRAVAEQRGGSVIGCTLAALLIRDREYACVWAGDSRIYRVQAGAIALLTRDHTEVQDLVDEGALTPEEARSWPRRNVITRAIGAFDPPELDIVQGQAQDGDVFILCSDGLTEHVGDREILDAAALRPPGRICDALVALTLERGAVDNVTVVAVCCGGAA
jgi:protein phosphatase